MIPDRRLVQLAAVPMLLAVAWVVVPGLLGVVLAVDVALVCVAVVDLARGRGVVRASREHGPVHSVGEPFDVHLTLHNDGDRTLEVLVGDDAPGDTEGLPAQVTVPARRAVTLTYRRVLHRRGRHVFGAIGLRWRSPMGLWWRQSRVAPPVEDAVRIYPDFAFLRQHGLKAREAEDRMPVRTRRRPGGESEFQRLRNYVPGDPYRHIDWKATARRQRFVSREYGQESNQNVIFLLDAGRTMTMLLGELTAFDQALNASLAMGHAALRHGDRVGLMAFDRTVRAWLPPRGGARTGGHLVQGTYDLFPSLSEPDYAVAFRHLQGAVRRRSLVVLLTAVSDHVNEEAVSAVVRALAGRHLPLVVWLRDPRLSALVDGPAEEAGAWYERAAAAEIMRWREASLETWRRRGALVVDCEPDQLSSQLVSQYLEIKARRLL